MSPLSPSDLARLRDLAEAYRDAMHLDNIIEGDGSNQAVQKASSTHVSRAAHRVAKAAAEVLLPEFPPRRNS